MKIAIFSDVHSNYEAFNAVINATFNKVDGYVCLGDILGYGASPNETIELLSKINLFGMVLGNHDIAVLDNDFSRFRTEHGRKALKWTRDNLKLDSMTFLKKFQCKHIYKELSIEIYHGGPQDVYWQYIFPNMNQREIKEIFKNKVCNNIFVGHSHLVFQFHTDSMVITNPGSVGQPRNGIVDAQYIIFDTKTKKIEFCRVPYDIKKTAEKIRRNGLEMFLAQRLFLGI